ncbi:unnamed protein product [Clonostachys rhizophaga]|uniref:Uncharacterized protein n=1 Tax=Clonostachys rhizophaga TaxID=160324 RepID=A0A9N9V1T8_9HYPO|nr:unnamed protein product [Clonostachys rhizophaga]
MNNYSGRGGRGTFKLSNATLEKKLTLALESYRNLVESFGQMTTLNALLELFEEGPLGPGVLGSPGQRSVASAIHTAASETPNNLSLMHKSLSSTPRRAEAAETRSSLRDDQHPQFHDQGPQVQAQQLNVQHPQFHDQKPRFNDQQAGTWVAWRPRGVDDPWADEVEEMGRRIEEL